MYICVYLCIFVYICVYLCILCIFVYICVYLCIFVYICVYLCIFVYIVFVPVDSVGYRLLEEAEVEQDPPESKKHTASSGVPPGKSIVPPEDAKGQMQEVRRGPRLS